MTFKSIKNRLTFWFLIVALPPLLITGVLNYRQRVNAIEERSFEKLSAIRDLKIKEISKWFDAKVNDLRTISEDPETRSLESIFNKETYSDADREFLDRVRESLYRFIENYTDYQEIYIIDPESGDIKVSTTKNLEGENRSGNPYLTEPLKTRNVYFKDIFYSKHINTVSMTFSIPIFCREKSGTHIVGILVLRVILEHSVYDLLKDYSGLGETGETLIINKDLMALNTLRGSNKPPLTLKMDCLAARFAAQGKTGIKEDMDYRGKKVLAAYGHIPKTGWGFVAKQDIDEINSPIRTLLANLIAMGLLLCIVVYLVVLFLSRSVAKPVLEMTDISKKIQQGDMSARNTCFTSDELGFLSRSFNQMADTLAYQMEIQKIGSDITDLLVKASTLMEFSEKIVQKLMAVTGADLGAIYLMNPENNRFEPYFSIGAMPEALQSFDGETLEGELGKVIANRAVSYIQSIPEETVFKIKVMPGIANPNALLTIPVVSKNKVMAVISLAGFNPFPEQITDLLKRSWIVALHTSFSNLLANEETKILAGELSYKNQELKEQADELTAQAEKLKLQSEELQKKNEELNQKRLQVEEANRMKSQFLSNMSHELRTPLNSVMALSRVLIMQSSDKLSEEEMKYLEIIERNGRHLLELINDILDLSKIESGKMDIVLTRFSMSLVVDVIIESLEPLAASKEVALRAHIPENFPDIRSDKTRVHQILQNIIGNAVKFTEKGSVTVLCREEGQMVYVDIRDTGIGIPEDQIHKIFEEFCQVDGTSSRKYQGTGLGLTIARRSAEMLGGDIQIKSVIGQGSTFTLCLPKTFSNPAGNPYIVSDVAEIIGKPSEKGMILVVDDDRHSASVISNYLKEEGYDTIIAYSGKEALEIARKTPVFAITIDIIMPEMDGLELLQALKQDPATQDIKAIIVSVSEDMETGFALGAMGYVSKPVKKSFLLKEIYHALRDEKENPSDYLIMITDDSDMDRENMEKIVTGEGMTAITANNGKACIDLMREITPDILILDLVMPEADGFQVLTYLQAHPQYDQLPIIIVTAKDLDRKEWQVLKDHVCSVLEKKNLSKDSLVFNIDKCMIGNRMQPHKENKPSPAGSTKPLDWESASLPLILVIEDNPDNMTTIRAVLRKDYRVTEAENGEAGLRKALTEKPDLILLDISLPGIDGVTLAKKFKTMQTIKETPLVALTAQAMKGDREKFLNAGCDEYVSKPFDPQKLMATIGMILSKGNLREENV